MAKRNNINVRYADYITLKEESKEKLMSLLMKMKEESGNPGLKLSIQKTKIMACGPIALWQIDGKKNGSSDKLYFLGLQNYCRG